MTEAAWKRAYLANILPASRSTTAVPAATDYVEESANPAGLTLADCLQYVALKIRRGMEVH
ncbi:hypothetical protein M758_UG216800 [Ceratodon purpureus]|nr:hypothetical protein M758_UG216800 [Ceratodon purpureus]